MHPELHTSTYRMPCLKPAGCRPKSIDRKTRPSVEELRHSRRTAGRNVVFACEICSQAGLQTTATFGKRGEKRARFCGICASRLAHASLVCITSCSTCCAFIAEMPAHAAPVSILRPHEPVYCKPCALDHCAVAHMPLTVDHFDSSTQKIGS